MARVHLNQAKGHYLDIQHGSDGKSVASAKDHRGVDAHQDAVGALQIEGYDVVGVPDGTVVEAKGSSVYYYFYNGRYYKVVIP